MFTIRLDAGGIFLPPIVPLGFVAFDDGVTEDVEGIVVFLEVLESELDDRDRGEVELERSAYLIRINPSRMY